MQIRSLLYDRHGLEYAKGSGLPVYPVGEVGHPVGDDGHPVVEPAGMGHEGGDEEHYYDPFMSIDFKVIEPVFRILYKKRESS